MIRLTVLYDLPDGVDEEEFLAWRLGEHQTANAGMPGVTYTDFARVVDSWPSGTAPRRRFMTIVDWPDEATFSSSFYTDSAQQKLHEDVKRIRGFEFYISEILVTHGARST
ncbi:MAG TPA: hypothetical protein VG815_10890 [Chloroflexota bacterium]|jgi:hypothetical protein|nr:hypothetical protein [Chloroflexota bacterium]